MNPADPVLLLIGDTPNRLRRYAAELESAGYNTHTIAPAQAAQQDNTADAVLLDMEGADHGPLDLIAALRARPAHSNLPVIIMTDHGSVALAVAAMQRGANDFLVRPFAQDALVSAIKTALRAPATREEKDNPTPAAFSLDFGGFIGLSPVMQALYEKIEQVAQSQAPVFITGESGTGKEVCAEAIHRHSRRAGKPFIPLNCGAIPRELIESELFGHVKGAFTGAIAERDGAAKLADGGTLFLDEIGEMPVDMQTKLLRFLQDQSFMKVGGSKQEKADVRIICATNRTPADEIEAGRFREDLYYRLHVLPLHMPPLRERGDDAIDIAEVLIRRYNTEEQKNFRGLSDDAMRLIRAYPWPGNIRQLQNVIRNVIVMNKGDMIVPDMLPDTLLRGEGAGTRRTDRENPASVRPLATVEREAIEQAIMQCGGNIPRAASLLGISPSTIYRKKLGWDENNDENAAPGHN